MAQADQNLEQIQARKEYQREYQREYRQKQKLLAEKDSKHLHKHLCNDDVNSLERDIEEDKKENKNKKKSVRENTRTLYGRLLPDYILSDELKAKMVEWITYKMERKEGYQEQGMKTLLRKIENAYLTDGDKALCEVIDDSMSNGWKGIIFDRLKQKENTVKPVYQKQTKAEELDDFYKMAAEWAQGE